MGNAAAPAEQPSVASFGELLREYRQRARLTQEQLAERSGISTRAISDLERGVKQAPHRTTVNMLASGLGLSSEDTGRLERCARSARKGRKRVDSILRFESLPEPPTSLIGRRRDVEEVVHRIRWGGARLLTLTGPGGVGKTRVALAAAAALQSDCTGGPVCVSLAPLRDPGLVAPTLLDTLGLQQSGSRTVEELLLNHLRERDTIIVLDNFEHLTDAAKLVSLLLAQCKRLRLILTSRKPLKIQGEQRLEIAPLEVPEADAHGLTENAAHYPAVELFVERSRAAKRDFSLTDEGVATVVEICRRLDGLPLAIELAAARMAHFSPQALLMRLSSRLPLLTEGATDLPPRQQTMRDTIDWSYQLLDEESRRLLRHLSVFRGGWDLGAAPAVSGGGSKPHEVLSRTGSLIDSSLVLAEDVSDSEPRYRMLETIREYAYERLEASGELEATRGRHAAHFMLLAEEAEPQLMGAGQATWMERLRREHDNLRAALEWARLTRDPELGGRLCAALWRFWLYGGYATEGAAWVQSFLPLLGEPSAKEVHAKALYAAGAMAFGQANLDEAIRFFEGSLEMYRELGEATEQAMALNGLGVAASAKSDYSKALGHLREATAIYRKLGDTRLLPGPLSNTANILRYQARDAEDLSEAIALYQESVDLNRQMGNRAGMANSLNNLALSLVDIGDVSRATELAQQSGTIGEELDSPSVRALALTTLCAIAIESGEDDQAWPLAEESLELFRKSGDMDMVGISLVNMGTLELRRGRHEKAEQLANEAMIFAKESGARRLMAFALLNLGDVGLARGDFQMAKTRYKEGLDVWREIDYLPGVVDAMERLASLACEQDEWQQAVKWYAAAGALRSRLGMPPLPVRQTEIERGLARSQEGLGDQAFNTAWQEAEQQTALSSSATH